MKKSLLLLVFFFSILICFSQVVPSSCTAPVSVILQYIDDADRLAVRKTFSDSTAYMDSVAIPQPLRDSLLGALIAVYNATSLPARDEVVIIYNIHSLPDISVDLLEVYADSNLLWMQQLKLGNIPTGNTQIDSFITVYNLNIQSYYDYFSWFAYHRVNFIADSNLNTKALADLFLSSPGVFFSYPPALIGDGNNITATITPNYIELIYSFGWGDCYAGCICKRYWQFKVYNDCSVEFVGSYGCPLPLSTNNYSDVITSFLIYPNPAFQQITLSFTRSVFSDVNIRVFNLWGEQVLEQPAFIEKQISIPVHQLPRGLYFMEVCYDGKKERLKFVKG